MAFSRPVAVFYVSTTVIGGSHHSLLGLIKGLPPQWRKIVIYTEHDEDFLRLYSQHGIELVHQPVEGIVYARYLKERPLRFVRDFFRAIFGLRWLLRKERAALLYSDHVKGRVISALATIGLPTKTMGYLRVDRSYGLVERIAHHLSSAYVVITRAVLKRALPWGKLLPKRTFMIYNGADPERFAPRPPDVELRRQLGLEGQRVIGFFGRYRPFKCPDVLLRSFALLKERGYAKVKLLLVGGAHEEAYPGFAQSLWSYAAEAGIEAELIKPGFVADTRPYIALCDVVTVPSDYEPFGRVVIEAMAMEKPVVGGGNGGIPEIITDGVDGVLVKPRDVESLTDGLALVLNDSALAERLGVEGRKTVIRRFTMAGNQARLCGLIAQLTKE